MKEKILPEVRKTSLKDRFECSDSMAAVGSMLAVFHLVMIHHSAALPQWVYRVNSCPDPKNISQWIEASKNLNCYHNLTSGNPTKQERIYHCLPSSFLNETLEFCSRSVLISSGNCPVYSYEFGTSFEPISYNCTNFISGCPTVMFKSKEVYKFPKCLKLRRKLRCFEAENNCTSMPKTYITYSDRVTNVGKHVTFLVCIWLFLLTMVVMGIILYKRSNQRCQKSGTYHKLKSTLQSRYSNCSTETEREKDQSLSSNELSLVAKPSDHPLWHLCLYSKQENLKINICGGIAGDCLDYIEKTTSNVESDQEKSPLWSSNELSSEAKPSDSLLRHLCLYSKQENSKINLFGCNAGDYLEGIIINKSGLVNSGQEKAFIDPWLSFKKFISKGKLSDPLQHQPCLSSKQAKSKTTFCEGLAEYNLKYIEITTSNLVNIDLKRADNMTIGYIYKTNTAVTLSEMGITSIVFCNFSRERNLSVETDGSMEDPKDRKNRSIPP